MRAVALGVALACSAPGLVAAQNTEEGPQTRNYDESLDQAARLTFQRAREAFVGGDYEEALRLFRQAYELSPRPVLLYNIAATLDRLRRDAEAVEALQAYLEADPEAPERAEIEARIRVLQAGIAEREAEAAARDAEQQQREAELEAERERLAAEDAERRAAASQDDGGRDGLHPAVFYATAGAAVAVGAVAAWSGANASSQDDDYRQLAADAVARGATPADVEEVREAFNEVEDAQFRTNLLIGIGGSLAVGALILVFVTDFGGDDDASAEARSLPSTLPQVAAGPDGFVVGASHRF